jgi:hypothetical protein
LDEPLTNLSYHVKILAENEAIELVRTSEGGLDHLNTHISRTPLELVEERGAHRTELVLMHFHRLSAPDAASEAAPRE